MSSSQTLDLTKLRFRLREEERNYDGEEEEFYDSEEEEMDMWLKASLLFPPTPGSNTCIIHDQKTNLHSLQTRTFSVQNDKGENIAHMIIHIIDRDTMMPGDFLAMMDEPSDELMQFAFALFDDNGRLKPDVQTQGTGVWGRELSGDRTGRKIFYIEEMKVARPHRNSGVGTWMLEHVWELDGLENAKFMFCWPTVLPEDRPSRNLIKATGSSSPEAEAEFDRMREEITRFFHKNHFRRVGTSSFFCLAKDVSHPSRKIPIEKDADLTLPEGPPPSFVWIP